MDDQSDSNRPAPIRRSRRRLRLFVIAGIAFLVLGGFLLFLPSPVPEEPLVWLNPDTILHHKDNVLTRIKLALIHLTAPLWSHNGSGHSQINIAAKVLSISDEVTQAAELGEPTATNADGARAWILSPDRISDFERRLKGASGVSVVSSPRLSVTDGTPAQMFVGQTAAAPGSVPIGLTTGMIPQIVRGSVKLKIAVVSTEAKPPSNGTIPSVETNLAVACQVLLPNAGGLVLDSGQAKHDGKRKLWLLVMPRATDAKGNLLQR